MIILQVTKNQGFTLSLKDASFEKPQDQIDLCPRLLKVNYKFNNIIKIKFSMKDSFGKCEPIYCKLKIYSNLQKKYLVGNL